MRIGRIIMARKSTKENKNIYQRTREALDLTREEASELLVTMSPERIEKIENERSLPHPDEVLVMAGNFLYVSLYISLMNSFLEEFFFRGFGFIP